jgi:hypothetical protein
MKKMKETQMTKPWIPFKLMPASWGLKGMSREIAQIEYECQDSYEKQTRIAKVKYADDLPKLKRVLLDIEANHGKIGDYEYDKARVDLEYEANSEAFKLAMNEVEFHHDKISENDRDKNAATIKGEPYVKVINSSFDPGKGVDGVYFELDWNQAWIDLLRENGYVGAVDELLVDQWFEDVCKSSANEKFNNEPVPFNSRRANSRPVDGKRTDYF